MPNLKNSTISVTNSNILKNSFIDPIFQKKIENICDLFKFQAQKSPSSIAIISENISLNYSDLDKRSDALAGYLCNQGVKPGDVVGLSLSKNADLIVGILGILKVGGTYLPLDPSYPEERLQYMIDDANPSLLLSHSDLADKLPKNPMCKTIYINTEWSKIEATTPLDGQNGYNIDPDAAAYIIYTSGSTGKPKGIVVAHRSLPNVVRSRFEIYPKQPISLLVGSISFDPTLLTILYTLVTGGSLCIPANESAVDLKQVVDLINEYSVNFILCVTSFYSMLLETADALPTLEYVFVGGEALSSSLPYLHSQVAPKANLFNEYGPAEHAIGGTIAKIYDSKQPQIFRVSIGKPLPNVQVYIMDQNLKPVSIDKEGEIFIGGIGLAKGYLNRQDLTAEKFMWVTLDGEQPIRLYRTGDWGRFLSNGDIEFLGRIDHQVKIWGHRIELAEIETALTQYSSVSEAIVVQEKENKYLIAFYSTHGSQDIHEQLHDHLSRLLPSYMIPSLFVKVNQWPKTPNGKIDREKLLALPKTSTHQCGISSFTLPQIEMDILEIWKEVLQLDDIGVNDNFFDLGGSSIQVPLLQALIEDKFRLKMSIIDLFQLSTITQLATHLQTHIQQLKKEEAKYCISKPKSQT